MSRRTGYPHVSTGVGIALVVAGAIVRFAVPATFTSGLNAHVVSVIVMLVGVFGLLLSLLVWGPLGRRHSPGLSSTQRDAESVRLRVAAHALAAHRERPELVSADAGPVTARPRARRGRVILRAAVPAALIAAAFGLALPRVASYRAVWASINAMTWPYALPITPGGLGITELGLIGILPTVSATRPAPR